MLAYETTDYIAMAPLIRYWEYACEEETSTVVLLLFKAPKVLGS